MFSRKPKKDPVTDELITQITAEMQLHSPETEEYKQLLANLEQVYSLRNQSKKSVSPDTLAIVAGNLLGILIIVAYEQKHVFTSKGLGQIIKPKT